MTIKDGLVLSLGLERVPHVLTKHRDGALATAGRFLLRVIKKWLGGLQVYEPDRQPGTRKEFVHSASW